MTAKEYLKQSYFLDENIASLLEEVAVLKAMLTSIQSPKYGERVQTSKTNEASFVKLVGSIAEFESRIHERVGQQIKLKKQISELISTLTSLEEQLVLRHRYVLGKTWEKIAADLFADATTIYRWHLKALNNFRLPEDAIIINK